MKLVADEADVIRFKVALADVARSVSEPEELLDDVARQSVYPAVMDIFDNEGYGAWAALTPAYALAKSVVFGELPILERTGNLRASLTLPNGTGSILQFEEDGSVAIGSTIPYAGVVNDIRPIAQFQDVHYDNMLSTATDHLGRVATGAGFEVIES